MTTLLDLFHKNHEVKTGLRGDPFLWRDMSIAVNYLPVPENPEEFEEQLYQLFHQITGKDLSEFKTERGRKIESWMEEGYQYVEHYGLFGMSGGCVDLDIWTESNIPILKKRFREVIEKGDKILPSTNPLTEFNYDNLFTTPTGHNECNFATGIKGNHTLFVIGFNPDIPGTSTEKNMISRIVSLSKFYGYDSFILFNLTRQPIDLPYERGQEPSRQPFFENAEIIQSLIPERDLERGCVNILATWGDGIIKDFNSRYSLFQIYTQLNPRDDIVWLSLDEFTKQGHPRNIKGAINGLILKRFDINGYIEDL
jgi:hypothetical protein